MKIPIAQDLTYKVNIIIGQQVNKSRQIYTFLYILQNAAIIFLSLYKISPLTPKVQKQDYTSYLLMVNLMGMIIGYLLMENRAFGMTQNIAIGRLELKVSLDHPLVASNQKMTLHAPPAMVATIGMGIGMESSMMLEMMSKHHVVSSRI